LFTIDQAKAGKCRNWKWK